MVGPILFIIIIGTVFTRVNQAAASELVPHLGIGLIVWTLLSGFVNGSTTIFQRYRAQVIQGELSLMDITMVGVFTTVLQFLHQVIVIFLVLFYFKIGLTAYSLVSLIGLALLVFNGVWLSIVFGIIGARFHDLSEIVQAIMRIGFLVTPIIWLPGEGGRAGLLGKYMTFNPFYHYLELVRAPLLGNSIAPISWYVVLSLSAIGFALAYIFKAKFAKDIALWV